MKSMLKKRRREGGGYLQAGVAAATLGLISIAGNFTSTINEAA